MVLCSFKKVVVFFSLVLSIQVFAKNYGHRAGADIFKDLPENSMIVLQASLEGIDSRGALQYHEKFNYLEFDIQETHDGEIVVFHDKDLTRMIPPVGANKIIYDELLADPEFRKRVDKKKIEYDDIRIIHLDFAQLRRFRLKGNYDQQVPTFAEYIEFCIRKQLIKPMITEIKYIHTDAARIKMIELLRQYKERYADTAPIVFTKNYDRFLRTKVGFLAFKKKFKFSLGSKSQRKYWCQQIIAAGFHGVFKARKKKTNMC